MNYKKSLTHDFMALRGGVREDAPTKSALIVDINRKGGGVPPNPYLLAVFSNTYGHP